MSAQTDGSRPLYLDSSALVKLVVAEAESAALRAVLPAWPRQTASVIVRVEVPRAVAKATPDPAAFALAEQVADGLALISLERDVLQAAARLAPATLRSLDAIHLASALSLGADLGGFVTYDERLATAARAAGIAVIQPR